MIARWLLALRWIALLALVLSAVFTSPPRRIGAREATATGTRPSAQAADENSFAQMLRLAPDILDGPEPPDLVATYANLDAQLVAVAAAVPESSDDEEFSQWAASTLALPVFDPISHAGIEPNFHDIYGFDLFQVDQSLTLGEPPNRIGLLRGKFDQAELRAAWKRTGYQDFQVGDTTVAFIRGDYKQDMTAPDRFALGQMNYALILKDGTLAFTSNAAAVSEMLDVEAGRASSLANRPNVRTLHDHLQPDLVAVAMVTGTALRAPLSDEGVAATVAPQLVLKDPLPPIQLAVLGITPGGPIPAAGPGATPFPQAPNQPRSRFEVALLMTDQAAAATAVPIILNRLATLDSLDTRRSYADLFPDRSARVAVGVPAILIDLRFGDKQYPGVWWHLVLRGDLLFLA